MSARLAPWRDWVGLLARLVLGGIYLVAGIDKARDISETQMATRAFEILPYNAANLWGAFMPFVEIVVGLLLIIGLFTRASAIGGSLLMVAFLIGIISVWVRGISINCGCFGGGGITTDPNYTWDVIRDLLLLLCGLWLVWRPRSKFSLDGRLWG